MADGMSLTPGVDKVASEKRVRQISYTKHAVEVHRAERKRRVDALNRDKNAIDVAVEAYRTIDNGSNEPVRIPRGFVSLKDRRDDEKWDEVVPGVKPNAADELASRPPMTKLVNRDKNTLSLLLTMLYVAQQETGPGNTYTNNRPNHVREDGLEPWARLGGYRTPGNARARRARLIRSLEALRRLEIVQPQVVAGSIRWDRFDLRSADGLDNAAVVMGDGVPSSRALEVPSAFFYQGWHLVLKPRELVMFLAIVDLTAQNPKSKLGVAFPTRTRRGYYGISDEVYQSIHLLEEFGLIKVLDTMEGRNRGKIKAYEAGDLDATRAPDPYRILYPNPDAPEEFEQPAVDRVLRTLKIFPVPPRLSDEMDFGAVPFTFGGARKDVDVSTGSD